MDKIYSEFSEPDTYRKVSGMALKCARDSEIDTGRRPVVIEIGCGDGEGTVRFAPVCGRVICVDDMHAGFYDHYQEPPGWTGVSKEKLDMFLSRVDPIGNCSLVMGLSLWPQTIKGVRDFLGDSLADVLVIDGCHHPFEAVWGDFEMYSPMVRPGGFVIFDDVYEECIMRCVVRAREQGFADHSRFAVERPWKGIRWEEDHAVGSIRQDTIALRKPDVPPEMAAPSSSIVSS
jgi:hypothetical protein